MGQESPPFRLCRVSPRLAHGGSRQRPTDSDGEYGRCFVGCIGRNGASCGGSEENGGRGRRAGPPHADAGHSLCASLHVGQGARGILQRRPWCCGPVIPRTDNRHMKHAFHTRVALELHQGGGGCRFCPAPMALSWRCVWGRWLTRAAGGCVF